MKNDTNRVLPSIFALTLAAGLGATAAGAGAQIAQPSTSTQTQGSSNSNSAADPAATPASGASTGGSMSTSGSMSGASSNASMRGSSMALPPSDAQFAKMAAQANDEEIAEGRLALSKTKSPVVRQFAERMVADHSQSNVSLRAAARTTRATIPNGMSPDGAAMVAKLRGLSGAAFDSAYMADAVPDHQNAVKLFTDEAQKGTSPTLKAYAQQQLPTVQAHLDAARAYVASNGTAGTSPTNQVGGGTATATTPMTVDMKAAPSTAAPSTETRSTNAGTTTTNTPNNAAASPAAH